MYRHSMFDDDNACYFLYIFRKKSITSARPMDRVSNWGHTATPSPTEVTDERREKRRHSTRLWTYTLVAYCYLMDFSHPKMYGSVLGLLQELVNGQKFDQGSKSFSKELTKIAWQLWPITTLDVFVFCSPAFAKKFYNWMGVWLIFTPFRLLDLSTTCI